MAVDDMVSSAKVDRELIEPTCAVKLLVILTISHLNAIENCFYLVLINPSSG